MKITVTVLLLTKPSLISLFINSPEHSQAALSNGLRLKCCNVSGLQESVAAGAVLHLVPVQDAAIRDALIVAEEIVEISKRKDRVPNVDVTHLTLKIGQR